SAVDLRMSDSLLLVEVDEGAQKRARLPYRHRPAPSRVEVRGHAPGLALAQEAQEPRLALAVAPGLDGVPALDAEAVDERRHLVALDVDHRELALLGVGADRGADLGGVAARDRAARRVQLRGDLHVGDAAGVAAHRAHQPLLEAAVQV